MTRWGFLIDENLKPQVAEYLEKEDYHAETVKDALGKGADDADVADYARRNDLIVVTNNVRDFDHAVGGDHAGVLSLDARRTDPFEIAGAIADVAEAYDEHGGPDAFTFDHLDDYL